MPRVAKRLGMGATISTLSRFLHPSAALRDRNNGIALPKEHRTTGLVALRQQVMKVQRKNQLCIICRHEDYVDDDGNAIELHVTKRNVKVEVEGDLDYAFDAEDLAGLELERAIEREEEEQIEIPQEILNLQQQQLQQENINTIQAYGIDIDDDNEPAPENVVDDEVINPNQIFSEWEQTGLCHRRSSNIENYNARLKDVAPELRELLGKVQLFEMLFPTQYVKETVIPETNKSLDDPMDYPDFLMFVGIWFLMATIEGCHRRDYWSTKPVDRFEGAPFRVNDLMSRERFDDILKNLKYVPAIDPSDKFREVRGIIEAWNLNMTGKFSSSWITCLDESMSPWTNKYTCPGFIIVPRKPWPVGNEYHTICCGTTGILFQLEMVEGKDARRNVIPKYEDLGGKTVGLLVRLTEPIHNKGAVVVLDSGFCVLQGIIELRKRGVFAAALIKKRRYWPKHIDGDAVAAHFEGKPVGTTEAWKGRLDNQVFHVFAMKEPDYTMSLMSTYGTTNEVETATTRRDIKIDGVNTRISFKYTEVIYNHFRYRHIVDDHNSKRHQPISLEYVWKTQWWPNRVFAYLLATTEVNVKLAFEYFGRQKVVPMLEFRKDFAKALIEEAMQRKSSVQSPIGTRKRPRTGHNKTSMPKNRVWKNGRWIKVKTTWSQRKCTNCKTKTRTYCSCNPSNALCDSCFYQHIAEMAFCRSPGD